MPKTKQGEVITWKEFFARWKQGIENLTPLQKLSNEKRSTFVSLIGYLVALVAVIWQIEKIGLLSYGLILIFIGSIWSTGLKWIALRQQYNFIKELDENMGDKDDKTM